MPTAAEHYARYEALNEAFFLIMEHPNPLAKISELRGLAHTDYLTAFNSECNTLHGLPEPADAARYGVTMVVEAPNAKAA